MKLKHNFATLASMDANVPRMIVDEEYLEHCRNIALILAHSDCIFTARWKVEHYVMLTGAETECES
jgi:hypothetical protein